jgi:hypothetical protein
MNPFMDIPVPDPSTIKRLVLLLFVVITLGVKLIDILEGRKTKANQVGGHEHLEPDIRI